MSKFDISKNNILTPRILKAVEKKCKYTHYNEHYGRMKFTIDSDTGADVITEDENLKTIFNKIGKNYINFGIYLVDMNIRYAFTICSDGKYLYDEYGNRIITLVTCYGGNLYKIFQVGKDGRRYNGTQKNIELNKKTIETFLLTYNEPTAISQKEFWDELVRICDKYKYNYRVVASDVYKNTINYTFDEIEQYNKVKNGKMNVLTFVSGFNDGNFIEQYKYLRKKYL